MCVSQFRDMTNASRFARREDMRATEITTDKAPYIYKHEYTTGTQYDTRLYVVDKAEVKKLAKLNNPYAIQYLKDNT